MQPCTGCGRPYDDSFADWSICRDCKHQQMEEALGEPVYMDGLGICWTQSDLEEAGGQREVDRLVAESRVWKKQENKKIRGSIRKNLRGV